MRPEYAAVMVAHPVTGRWELMSNGGRVIVFDTARVAWEVLPLLGKGRPCRAAEANLSLTFLEVSRLLPNRARVVSPYDPDEAQPWRKHIIWSEWMAGEVVSRW